MAGSVSKQTRNNWMVDMGLFISAIAASISGIYFLFFPTGGFRGGRNPYYGITILFERHTWEDLHIWTGIAMIVAALIHLAIHWKWVVGMARRIFNEVLGRCECMNGKARFNVFIDAVIGLSFAFCSVSGLYFFFYPAGTYSPGLLFSTVTWDLVHTWSGIIMIVAAMIHFYIHWNWVVKVTRRIFSGRGATYVAFRQSNQNLAGN